MDIKELQAVEFPHEAIVTEFEIDINKLPVPLKAKILKVNKSINALTDDSTDEQVEDLLNESTLLSGVLINEYVDKADIADAKNLLKDVTEEVADVIEDDNVEPPAANEKVRKIVGICKQKGSISIEQLKEIGLKSFADTIVLSTEYSIDKRGDVYVLRKDEVKEGKGDGIVGTLLAGVAAIGLVFGLSRYFKNK